MYLESILERGDAPFDPQWMQQTSDTFWARAKDSVLWTEMMLEPLPQHAQQFPGAAAAYPEIARTFARFFPCPDTVREYLADPAAYLESVAAAR